MSTNKPGFKDVSAKDWAIAGLSFIVTVVTLGVLMAG